MNAPTQYTPAELNLLFINLPPEILEGGPSRNKDLLRAGGKLRNLNMERDGIDEALQLLNTARCVPPLSDSEVSSIAKSAGKMTIKKPVERAGAAWPTEIEWKEPGTLPEVQPPVPGFNPLMLPVAIRSWVEDIADRIQ
jgi:hypothetical protein